MYDARLANRPCLVFDFGHSGAQPGVPSKRLDGSSWILTHSLSSACPML